jgi:hypothetical protein
MSDALERLRRRGEEFLERRAREEYRAHAGLASGAALQPIYAAFRDVYDADAVAATREAWLDAPDGSEERRAARHLLEWVSDTRAAQRVAPVDERILAWEAGAVVRAPDGRQVPYPRVTIAIANERERAERLRLDDARARLVGAELAPLREERLRGERDAVEELGLADGYVRTVAATSGIDLAALAGQARPLLRDTQAMWDDVLVTLLRANGMPRAEATRADALALFRLPAWDTAFPGGAMQVTIRGQVEAMGIDPDAGGRIRYDVGERPGKRARAFCAPVRVPHEVHLVLRPQGGQGDWRTFLHELGHALHFAHVRPELPFEDRWLGDNSVTEGYAMLLDHLPQDRGWLRRYTDVGAKAEDFLRLSAMAELHFLRRYAGKLLYELELYGGQVPWSALPDLYVETLATATGFRYQHADALVDVDPRLYSARYLRAWQLQAVLGDALRERFDEDWFRNPATGPWMVLALFGEGQREDADGLARRVAGAELAFAPVVRAIEARLA